MAMPIVTTCCGCCGLRGGLLGYSLFTLMVLGAALCYCFYVNNNAEQLSDSPEVVEHLRNQALLQAGSCTLYSLIWTSMFYGVLKRKRTFLMPYLIIQCIVLALFSLVAVTFMFYTPQMIPLVLLGALHWYIWICALSFYQMLGEPNNPVYIVTSTAPQQVGDNKHFQAMPPSYPNIDGTKDLQDLPPPYPTKCEV